MSSFYRWLVTGRYWLQEVRQQILNVRCFVAASLPGDVFADTVVQVAAKEQTDEEGDAEDGDRNVGGGKVRAGDAVVEAKEGADPEQQIMTG